METDLETAISDLEISGGQAIIPLSSAA